MEVRRTWIGIGGDSAFSSSRLAGKTVSSAGGSLFLLSTGSWEKHL